MAPNVAVRLSTLITSALIGTRMLPNIRNSSTKVDTAISSKREREPSEERRLAVDEVGRRAGHEHVVRGVEVADVRDERLGLRRLRGDGRHDGEPGAVVGDEALGGGPRREDEGAVDVAPGAGVDAGDVVELRQRDRGTRRSRRSRAAASPMPAATTWMVLVSFESKCVLDLGLDLAARRRLGEHPLVGLRELGPQERRSEHEQERHRDRGHRHRPPHHERRDAVPDALADRLRLRGARGPTGRRCGRARRAAQEG